MSGPRAPPGTSPALPATEVERRLRAAGISTADLKDLGDLYLRAASAAARSMLLQTVRERCSRPAEARHLAEVGGLWPEAPLASVRLEFADRVTGRAGSAHLYAGESKAPHPMGRELDKIRPRIDEKRWPEVLEHLSRLLAWVRQTYAAGAARLSPDNPARLSALSVDPSDSSLFVEAAWPLRVGLFVHLGDDPPERATPP